MVSCFLSRIVILLFGTLYPAYASYKAVRTKNVKEYVKWMMYWIVFALFTCFETFTDLFLSFWFPFYYELKIITVIYLLSPATNGSSILYRKFVHPVLAKREQEIDDYIAKAKEQGYHTMLNLGSKGVTYATSLLMQTAIKGGGGLVSHIRKSYSLGDLSEDQQMKGERHEVDGGVYENYREMRRSDGQTPRRMIPITNDSHMYFPEVDAIQRPVGPYDEYYGVTSEEGSSGNLSRDQINYGYQVPHMEPLIRTASMGASTRARTRASARNALPKRSSLTEGTWSPGEMCESQREIDNCFFLPISHSSSVPFSLDPSNNNSNFEQLKLLRELTQEQLMALLGAMQTSSSHKIPENNNIDAAKTKQVLRTCQVPEVMNDEYYGTSDMENRDAKEAESNTEGVKIIELNSNDDNRELSPAEKDKVENIARPARTKERRPSLPKNNTIPTVEFDDEEFSTPNSSPKDSRKNNLSSTKIENESEETVKADKNVQHLDVPKKTKTKSMKISKKLHLPKFSFWSHKSGKLSSGSENSSVASTENIVLATENSEKNDLEYFISLKGDLDSETQNGK